MSSRRIPQMLPTKSGLQHTVTQIARRLPGTTSRTVTSGGLLIMRQEGALTMLEDGLLEKFPIDQIYGLHNMPGVPLGTYQVRSGPLLASFDRFAIELLSGCRNGIRRVLGGRTKLHWRAENPRVRQRCR